MIGTKAFKKVKLGQNSSESENSKNLLVKNDVEICSSIPRTAKWPN